MRGVIAGLMLTLWAGGISQAAERVGSFSLPPPAPREVLPMGEARHTVKLARVVIQLPDGQQWASMRWGNFRFAGTPLVWEAGKSDLEPGSFARVLSDEFRASGFKLETDTENLFGPGSGADLQLGVLIDDLKGRFCLECHPLMRVGEANGAVLMNVEWQVYSSLDRKIVARIRTMGGYETTKAQTGATLHITMGAFRENARQLLINPEFRALITGSFAANSVSVVPKGLTLPLQGAAATSPRTIAQAVAVAPVVFSGDGMGSGFLVSRDGYVITNQHVVGAAKFVKVRWPDGTEALGDVIRTDSARDVALIKTDPNGRTPLGLHTGIPSVGDTVFAIGAPLEEKLQGSVTKGIVSALRTEKGQRLIQSDVSINHGNSGGPLVNEKGQVVAIAVSGMFEGSAPMGLNFFIPIADALTALNLQPAP